MQQKYIYIPLSEPIPINEQVWPEGTLPLVSICSITYNHEPFIRECLEGFLMQKTTFPVEIIIHDDASTDKTAEIIKEYELKYPNLFKPIYQKENQYSKCVAISATYLYPRAKGKYIAKCEGDDYWIDPLKLQKQVDFLEANPDCSLCFHNANILYFDNKTKISTFKVPKNKFIFRTKDIIRLKWFVPTASILFRKKLLPEEYPKWFIQSKSGDVALQLLMSKYGYLYYLPSIMSIYRFGTPSSITVKNRKNPLLALKNYIKMLEVSNKEYFNNQFIWDFRYRKFIYFLSAIKYNVKRIWK